MSDDNVIAFPTPDPGKESAHEIQRLVQIVGGEYAPILSSLFMRVAALRYFRLVGVPQVILDNQKDLVAKAFDRLGAALEKEVSQ